MGISQDQIKSLVGDQEEIVVFEVGCVDGLDTKKFLVPSVITLRFILLIQNLSM